MKFLHLCAADSGGAGIAAWRLHDRMRADGHASSMVVLDKRTQDTGVIVEPGPRHWFRVTRLLSKASLKLLADDDYYFQDQLASSHPDPERLLDRVGYRPDVIVAHYLSQFLAAPDLLALHRASGAPVIFHLLDMAAMTGGCHYAWSCQGYEHRCGNCPALRFSAPNDRSANTIATKEGVLRQVPSMVVAGSSWLASQAAESTLFAKHRIETVLLGVSPQDFVPRDHAVERKALGLQGEGPVLFFGAQRFDQRRKGMTLLLDALRRLAAQWPGAGPRPTLLIAGDARDFTGLPDMGFECRQLGYINTETLARAYAAADIFACPSIEDSGPMMINESLMCGTPVVAFRMGVADDLLDVEGTGVVAPLGDVSAFASGLSAMLLRDEAARASASLRCREVALERCALPAQTRRFVDIAESFVGSAGATVRGATA